MKSFVFKVSFVSFVFLYSNNSGTKSFYTNGEFIDYCWMLHREEPQAV